MKAVLIDTSGGMAQPALEEIRKDIKIGDLVVMFDTHLHLEGVMTSQDQIDTFKFRGGGGTLLAPALEYAVSREASEIVVYSDGYFADRSDILYTLIKV